MAGLHQRHVDAYHNAMAASMPHHAHNMHLFHRNWHRMNPDPGRDQMPPRRDANWGTNLVFGTNFLEMHHEMVKAGNDEPRQHMHHESIAAWYAGEGLAAPDDWDPSAPIPEGLAYEPELDAFPPEIRAVLQDAADARGITPAELLTRHTDSPNFQLPRYFTRQGVGPGERAEPLTGARRLGDFKNANQLGCCIVFPHNSWHGAIGGAMASTWTAIADPIFYWGVHWHIDRVYDDFKLIQQEKQLFRFDSLRADERLIGEEDLENDPEFGDADREFIEEALSLSTRLSAPPGASDIR